MKVKDFIKELEDIGYNEETELVFHVRNKDKKTYKDYYCQHIYRLIGGYNATGIEIDDYYI